MLLLPYAGKKPRIHRSAWIARTATIIGDVEIGPDSSVFYGSVLRGDVGAIVIGARCNVQDGAVIHVETGHTTVLEEDVTVGHLALVHGCHVESACLIGMSSTVLSGARVGEGSIVGGGGVVLEGQEIPPFSVAAGVPAKVRKTLAPETREQRVKHAAGYVELARRHREGLAEHEV